MNAFEKLVAELLWLDGYWVQTGIRVNLTKEEKVEIGRPSAPSWPIGIVAYRGVTNELLAIVTKSFFDSTGVTISEFEAPAGTPNDIYKLFREHDLRRVILRALRQQMIAAGLCPAGDPAQLGLVVGKIKKGDEQALEGKFEREGWFLRASPWLRSGLKRLSENSFRDHQAAVAAKILLRD